MTDHIEEIAAEMEQYSPGSRRLRTLAARLRAWWSPERKAFHEAAMAEKAHSLATPSGEAAQMEWAKKMGDLEIFALAAYRALCESEKKP